MREQHRRLLTAFIVAGGLSISLPCAAAVRDHGDHHGSPSVVQSFSDVLQQLIQQLEQQI